MKAAKQGPFSAGDFATIVVIDHRNDTSYNSPRSELNARFKASVTIEQFDYVYV
jgi:hypothetical protein